MILVLVFCATVTNKTANSFVSVPLRQWETADVPSFHLPKEVSPGAYDDLCRGREQGGRAVTVGILFTVTLGILLLALMEKHLFLMSPDFLSLSFFSQFGGESSDTFLTTVHGRYIFFFSFRNLACPKMSIFYPDTLRDGLLGYTSLVGNHVPSVLST